jgi:hypothetical protein
MKNSVENKIKQKTDVFIHVDEIAESEDEIRKTWTYLHNLQTFCMTQNIILVYYLSAKLGHA